MFSLQKIQFFNINLAELIIEEAHLLNLALGFIAAKLE